MNLFSWTLSCMRPYRGRMIFLSVLALAQIVLGLLSPWPLKLVVDNVLGGEPLPATLSEPIHALAGASSIGLLVVIVSAGLLLQLASQVVSMADTQVQVETVTAQLQAGKAAQLNAKIALDSEIGGVNTSVAQLQAQLPIKLVGSLVVHTPTLAQQQNVDAPIAISDTGCTNLPDASLEAGLVGSTGTVVKGRDLELNEPAGPADRDVPLAPNTVDKLALTTRPQIFRRITSGSISRSSERSATSLRSLAFSSSSCFSRRISGGVSPSNFFFQLK